MLLNNNEARYEMIRLPHLCYLNKDYSVQEMDWVGQEAIAESISASVLPVGLMTSA